MHSILHKPFASAPYVSSCQSFDQDSRVIVFVWLGIQPLLVIVIVCLFSKSLSIVFLNFSQDASVPNVRFCASFIDIVVSSIAIIV